VKYYFIALLLLISGALFSILGHDFQQSYSSNSYDFSYDGLSMLNTELSFLDIFLNNLFVAFLLSVLGFLTGGLLSSIILFWNGYLLGIIYSVAFYTLPLSDIIYSSKHVPTELYALIAFSTIGFQGFRFCRDLIVHGKISKQYIPGIKKVLLPTILLFISSILEVL